MSAACKQHMGDLGPDLPEKICQPTNKTSEPFTTWVGCGHIAGAQWCDNSCVSHWETERGACVTVTWWFRPHPPVCLRRDPGAWMKSLWAPLWSPSADYSSGKAGSERKPQNSLVSHCLVLIPSHCLCLSCCLAPRLADSMAVKGQS